MRIVALSDIQKTLLRFNYHYPEAGHNPETLAELAADYNSLFDGWSVDDFNSCCRQVLKSCRFWPKISDFYAAFEQIKIEKESGPIALPEPQMDEEVSEEQRARNIELANILYRAIAKKITFAEALRQQKVLMAKPLTTRRER